MSKIVEINSPKQLRDSSGSPAELTQVVAQLLSLMPVAQGLDPSMVVARVKLYAEILGDLPTDKVQTAIKKFLSGEFGDGRFAPTPAQIRQAVLDPCYGEHDLRFTPDDRLSNEQYWKKRRQLKEWGPA